MKRLASLDSDLSPPPAKRQTPRRPIPLGADGRPTLPLILMGSKCKVRALVDSGNTLGNAISQEQFNKLSAREQELVPAEVSEVGTAGKGGTLQVTGRLKHALPFRIQGHTQRFYFRPNLVPSLAHPVNLGWAWLKRNDIMISPGDNVILVKDKPVIGAPQVQPPSPDVADLYVTHERVIRPQSIAWISVRPKLDSQGDPLYDLSGDFLVEGSPRFHKSTNAIPWVAALTRAEKGSLEVQVLNPTQEELRIRPGLRYGTGTQYSVSPSPAKAPSHICALAPQPAKPAPQRTTKERAALIRRVLRMAEWDAIEKDEDRVAAVALLVKHFDLFAFDGEYGCTSVLEHRIELKPGTKPHRARSRELNPAMEDALVKQVEDWLAKDVIFPCSSEWNTALVPVVKGQKIRFCLDFRPLNRQTIKDTFTIGETHAKMACLGGSTIFSVVDGSGAFLQVPIAKDSQHLTAFSTRRGVFAFKRMPFGLCNAPSTYGRLVAQVLGHLPWTQALSFVDDTIVHSRTMQDHLASLDAVFTAFVNAGLKLGPEKCELFRRSVKFLGHKISKNGIHVLPDYIEVITQWPLPKTRKAVRQFLGKAGYYRRFIRGFQHIAGPLTEKLKQDDTPDGAEFEPSKAFIEAFEKLKAALVKAPVLGFPDFNSSEPFILDTDFSVDNRAIGGTLSQVQEGVERPLAFSSVKMSPAQANYSPHKGELAGVVCMIQKYKWYLWGRCFRLRVDAAALKWIKTCEPPKGLTARWLALLADYDFEVEWRAGRSHGNADSLSRAPHAKEDPSLTSHLDDSVLVGALSIAQDSNSTEDEVEILRHQQQEDPDLQAVSKLLRREEEPGSQFEKTMSPEACRLWEMRENLFIDGKGLLRVRRIQPQDPMQRVIKAVVVPREQQEAVVRRMHEAIGHRGRQETVRKVMTFFYFSGASEVARNVIAQCLICQQKGRQQPPQRGHLHSHQASYPFQVISIDFVGPIKPASGGCSYLVTCLDVFSRWFEAKAVPACTSKEAIDFLAKDIFPRFGLCEKVHSDNGAHFTSSAFVNFLSSLKIEQSRTPTYNPRSNPVERAHRTLMDILKKMATRNPGAWKEMLPAALFSMRTSVHSTTGLAPYQVLFGRPPNLELDQVFRLPSQQLDSEETPGSDLQRRILEAHEYARQHSAKMVARSRRNYLGEHRTFQVGDLVWLYTPRLQPGRGKKFSNFYSGPWQVIKRVNQVCYKLAPRANWLRNDRPVVTVDRIKRFVCSAADDLDDLAIPPPKDLDLTMAEDEDALQFDFDGDFEPEETNSERTPRDAEEEPVGRAGASGTDAVVDLPAPGGGGGGAPELPPAGSAAGERRNSDPGPAESVRVPEPWPLFDNSDNESEEPAQPETATPEAEATPAATATPAEEAPAARAAPRARPNEAERLAAEAARFAPPAEGRRVRAPRRLLQHDPRGPLFVEAPVVADNLRRELGSNSTTDRSHSEYRPSREPESTRSSGSPFP